MAAPAGAPKEPAAFVANPDAAAEVEDAEPDAVVDAAVEAGLLVVAVAATDSTEAREDAEAERRLQSRQHSTVQHYTPTIKVRTVQQPDRTA